MTDARARTDVLPLPENPPTMSGCLLRLFWQVLGKFALCGLAILIWLERPWTLGLRDVLFWATVAAVLVVRHFDLKAARREARTSVEMSEVDTGWRGAIVTVVVSAGLWGFAQSVQPVGE